MAIKPKAAAIAVVSGFVAGAAIRVVASDVFNLGDGYVPEVSDKTTESAPETLDALAALLNPQAANGGEQKPEELMANLMGQFAESIGEQMFPGGLSELEAIKNVKEQTDKVPTLETDVKTMADTIAEMQRTQVAILSMMTDFSNKLAANYAASTNNNNNNGGPAQTTPPPQGGNGSNTNPPPATPAQPAEPAPQAKPAESTGANNNNNNNKTETANKQSGKSGRPQSAQDNSVK